MAQKYYSPKTLKELHTNLVELTPQSKIISGGTDLVIRLNMGVVKPDALLYMGSVDGISSIVETDDAIEIGAMATMSQIAKSGLLREHFPALVDGAADVGCKQIRNNGTIGGNIANASAAGDLIPVMFLYGAGVSIATADGIIRTEPIDKVVVGPGKTTLDYNDAIVRFILKKSTNHNLQSAFVKLGSRKSLTISRIGLAIQLDMPDNRTIKSAAVIAGAISLTPVNVTVAEEYLVGKILDENLDEPVGKALSDLIMKITPEMFDRDYKAGAAYGVAQDVLQKLRIALAEKQQACSC